MKNSAGSKYAFVVPRYGRGIGGGAETLAGELARKLAARGDDIEVLTTCARDNRTWEDEFPPGETVEDGVRVRRFPVRSRNLDLWVPLQIRLSEGLHLASDEELTWMEHSVNSDELYLHLARFAPRYRAVFFAPYLFGTTFWGSLIHPHNSVLIPCLHDEAYAYTKVVQSMFRAVRGCLFNAGPEADLAWDLYGHVAGGEVGMGFDGSEREAAPPYFPNPFPYLLYLGRKETGKNAHLLVRYFMRAKDEGLLDREIRLVVAGGGSFGDLHIPEALARPDIVDLSHVSESEKRSLLAHAVCLVQPSVNESFSIVIMEAWLEGVPAVVHARCPVTKHHAERSGGGLYFGDFPDFVGVMTRLCGDPALCRRLAESGRRYVRTVYSWDAVLDRFDSAVDRIFHEKHLPYGSEEASR